MKQTRRRYLASTGAVAIGVGLAGCSGGGPPAAQTSHSCELTERDAVAFEHYDFPIPVSDWSGRVANAARSVQEAAGDEAFFAFSEAAYASQDDYSWQVVGDLADEAGVDACRVLSDVTYETYEAVLGANRAAGEEREIPGTPAVYVGDTLTEPTYEAVSTAIEAARNA